MADLLTTAQQHYRTRVQALIDEGDVRQRYWTVRAARWQALCQYAEESGILIPDLLRDMGIAVLDTSTTGDVHLG
jgi:hypothetical protein